MSQPQRSSSTDSASESLRKRVCKACDRCRLKKSKCDGATPCSRCRADNAICVFGERKKSHDKVYPKGYVEMLEQQQGQLVSGLQEMYRRSIRGQGWPGPMLSETSGNPLTHDILAALGLLEAKNDGSGEMEEFETDCRRLQRRLFDAGAPSMRRKSSFSSDSDHSIRDHGTPATTNVTKMPRPAMFQEPFTFSNSPSPTVHSPAPQKRQSYPPLQQSPLHHERQLSQDWPGIAAQTGRGQAIMRSNLAMNTPHLDDNLDDITGLLRPEVWMEPALRFDSSSNDFASYPARLPNSFDTIGSYHDFGASLDSMEVDFNTWIQVQM